MLSIHLVFVIVFYFSCVFAQVNLDRDYTTIATGKNGEYQRNSSSPYWTFCSFDYICFIAACSVILTQHGGIKAILVLSSCLSTGIILTSVGALRGALHSQYYLKQPGAANLFTVLRDIATSSSDLELAQQSVIAECTAAIFLCLMQISLTVLVLCEENDLHFWKKSWLVLHVPATFFTLYTVFSNQCFETFPAEYEIFKKSVLWNLMFIYFALPSLIFFEKDRRFVTYHASPEIRV